MKIKPENLMKEAESTSILRDYNQGAIQRLMKLFHKSRKTVSAALNGRKSETSPETYTCIRKIALLDEDAQPYTLSKKRS